MTTDTEETMWVEDDLGVDITLNPHPFPFPAAYTGVVSAISVPVAIEAEYIAPAAQAPEQWAAQQAEGGRGLYVAFDDDGNGAVVCVENSIAHLLDGFRLR